MTSISARIEFLWEKKYTDALGAGEADPFAYADAAVAPLRAHLRRVERAQSGQDKLRRGNRAGRLQYQLRRGGL